ncbi:MAG: methylated-DNA--[protein]-cysteine S-methyltransferase [Candidatus Nezhaarchaeales archaeon]
MKKVIQGFVYVDRLDDLWIAVIIDEEEKVVSVSLPRGSENEAVNEAKSNVRAEVSYKFRSEMNPFVKRVGKEVVKSISSYLKGEKTKFELKLNTDGLSEFMKKVLSIATMIPRGFVTCYGCVAEVLGKPNASSAIGYALAENPWPIIVPCHRVIRSDLSLGGYKGGVEMKKMLLKVEGVAVTLTNKVLPSHFLRAEELKKLSRDVGKT